MVPQLPPSLVLFPEEGSLRGGVSSGVEEIAHPRRSTAVLAGLSGPVSSTPCCLTAIPNSRSGDPAPSSGLSRYQAHMHAVRRCTHRQNPQTGQ